MFSLRSVTGFFLVLLGPISWQHLTRRNDFGEVLDSIVSTLMFTLAYAAGLAIVRLVHGAHAPHAFWRGAAAGAVALALAVALWLSIPHHLRDSLYLWGLGVNLVLCALAAVLVEFAWPRATSHVAR